MSGNVPILYCYPNSFYSQKAIWALAEKKVPVKQHCVSLVSYENYSDWYMKINPKGQVPVLVVDGKPIPESVAIVKYADDHSTEGPQLMPEETKETWTEFQRLFESIKIEVVTYGIVMNPDLVPKLKFPAWFQRQLRAGIKQSKRVKLAEKMKAKNPGMAEIYDKKIPEIKEFELAASTRECVAAELDKVQKILSQVEAELAKVAPQEWLCGSGMTLADISLGILLHRLYLAGCDELFWEEGRLPMVKAYYERLRKRKTFQDIVVNPTHFSHLLGTMWELMPKWVPVVSGLVLVASIGAGYLWYKK